MVAILACSVRQCLEMAMVRDKSKDSTAHVLQSLYLSSTAADHPTSGVSHSRISQSLDSIWRVYLAEDALFYRRGEKTCSDKITPRGRNDIMKT